MGALFCERDFLENFFSVSAAAGSDEKPSADLIEKFDSAIQQRFLTEPCFGITRINLRFCRRKIKKCLQFF